MSDLAQESRTPAHSTPTAAFVRDAAWQNPAEACAAEVAKAVGMDNVGAFDADGAATKLMGDSIYTNPMMLGYAWQKGWIPLAHASLMRAIELNAVAVDQNKAAFEWGRRAAHDWASVQKLLSPAQVIEFKKRETLESIVARRVEFLTAYQNEAYADAYSQFIDKVRLAEMPLGKTTLSEAVARNLFKLMAYKDEYEVARLHTDRSFLDRVVTRIVELDTAFGQIEFKRLALVARLGQQGPAIPERPKGRVAQRMFRTIYRRLCLLIGEIGSDPDDSAGKTEPGHLPLGINLEVTGKSGPIVAFLQRAHIRRQAFGKHRDHPVGKVDAVSPLARFLVDQRSVTDIEGHVCNRHDGIEPSAFGRRSPDRIIMIARIGRVDRDNRQMTQVLAVLEGPLRHRFRLCEQIDRKDVGYFVFVYCNQAEGARCKGITQHFLHTRRDPWRTPGFLREDQVPCLRAAKFGNQRILAIALVDGLQPISVAFHRNHAEHQFLAPREFLHRVRDMAVSALLDARKNAVADPKCAAAAAFDHTQFRHRDALGFPAFRDGNHLAVINIDDPQDRDLGQATHLVERAAGCRVYQPFIRHILEQSLERDLLGTVQPKGPRDFPLARGAWRHRDEIEDLLARRQTGGTRLWHE